MNEEKKITEWSEYHYLFKDDDTGALNEEVYEYELIGKYYILEEEVKNVNQKYH